MQTAGDDISEIGRRPNNKDQESHEQSLFECADLILPWLNPAELAATSSTCKTLNCICKSITAGRASDASRGLESLPVPSINAFDGQLYAYFLYTPTQTLGIGPDQIRQPWSPNYMNWPGLLSGRVESFGDDEWGCGCDRCDEGDSGCPCAELSSGELTRECGPSCGCRSECGNRLTQRGLSVEVKIVKDGRKGWGLFAAQPIRRGQFVCEYAGELLTTEEARRRQRKYDQKALGGCFSSALLVVREHLPSGKACMRMNIDATVIGNVARFINHSCDGGNLSTVLVRSSGALLPRLCFFASRDIPEDEELTFCYGEPRVKSKGMKCFCGSSCCFGMLPSENT